jgi:hypothetical protein
MLYPKSDPKKYQPKFQFRMKYNNRRKSTNKYSNEASINSVNKTVYEPPVNIPNSKLQSHLLPITNKYDVQHQPQATEVKVDIDKLVVLCKNVIHKQYIEIESQKQTVKSFQEQLMIYKDICSYHDITIASLTKEILRLRNL